MQLDEVIRELKTEREQLAMAIECLERVAQGRGRGRGRPPAWLKNIGQMRQTAKTNSSKSPVATQKGRAQAATAPSSTTFEPGETDWNRARMSVA